MAIIVICMPWNARPTTSPILSWTRAQTRVAMLNSVIPNRRTFLWPKMSPSRPPAMRKPPNYFTQVSDIFFFFLTSRGWEGIYSQGIRSQNPLNGSLVIAKCFLNSRQGDVGHSQVCNVNEENEASGMGFRSAFIIVCYPSYMDIHNSQCRERRGPI